VVRAGLGHLQRSIITGFMSMASTGALEVLLGLPPLHLITEAEAKASACKLCGKGMFGQRIRHRASSSHKTG
jgi:hypothetical protein